MEGRKVAVDADRIFRTLMGESAWEEHLACERAHEEDAARFATMTDAQLAEEAARYLRNCRPCEWPRGTPVYDAVMAHVIVPEMIARLRD